MAIVQTIKPARVSLRVRKVMSGITYFIDYYDPGTGQRVRRSVGQDKKKAELRRSEIEWKLFRGETGDLPAIVSAAEFESFFKRFLDHCMKTRSAASVMKDHGRHETLRKFFLEEKEIHSLQEVTPGMVQELQAGYLDGHSVKSWNCLLSIQKNMLNRAVEWGVIEFNPIAQVKPMSLEQTFRFFSREEVRKILRAADDQLRPVVMILLHTGIRRSELWNLRWRDVDIPKRRITIKAHGAFKTKSGKLRSIPVTKELQIYLKTLSREGQYVCRPYGHIHSLRRFFVALLGQLGIEGTLHDLRHTFASHLATAGVPIPVIKELLGHADISTTMIYAHLSPGIHESEIDRLKF